jgi:hypothetical protein
VGWAVAAGGPNAPASLDGRTAGSSVAAPLDPVDLRTYDQVERILPSAPLDEDLALG